MSEQQNWNREATPRPAGGPVTVSSPLVGRHLYRSFGDGDTHRIVVRDVSVELRRGEFTLLMGPSGSGKTTLLAVLSGLLRPDSGEVLALQSPLWQGAEADREQFRLHHCGFIFQGYNLFQSLTVWQQLEMVLCWGEGLSRRAAGARVVAMLDLLGLAGKGNRFPDQLSGGEKQRVAIGRALIKNPTFCFADEPTAALDWAHGRQVIELLQAVARKRAGVVLVVGHDARIIPFADRLFLMEDGCLAEQRPELPVPEEVLP